MKKGAYIHTTLKFRIQKRKKSRLTKDDIDVLLTFKNRDGKMKNYQNYYEDYDKNLLKEKSALHKR